MEKPIKRLTKNQRIQLHVDRLVAGGMPKKQALKQVKKALGS